MSKRENVYCFMSCWVHPHPSACGCAHLCGSGYVRLYLCLYSTAHLCPRVPVYISVPPCPRVQACCWFFPRNVISQHLVVTDCSRGFIICHSRIYQPSAILPFLGQGQKCIHFHSKAGMFTLPKPLLQNKTGIYLRRRIIKCFARLEILYLLLLFRKLEDGKR